MFREALAGQPTAFVVGSRFGEVIDAAKGAGVTKVGIVTEAMRRAGGAAPVGN